MKITIIEQKKVPPSDTVIPDQWFFPDNREIEFDCIGTGINIDPIQIDDRLHFPKRATFRNYKHYFQIEDIKSKKLGIDICENITFENCTFSLVRLRSSTNIKFKNAIINRDVRLKECDNITFENCFIKNAILFKSKNIFIKESYFVQLRDWMSKNNTLEKNEIRKLETNVKEASFKKRNVLNDNEIRKTKYKLKKLFIIGPKALLKSSAWWLTIIFLTIWAVVLFSIVGLNDQSKNLGVWLILIVYSPFIYMGMLILASYIPEYYYKIKLRIKSEK
ncbi:MAG: hypothetical protein EU535_07240 [Promethearchaeota archaeon]|nr:MAG: hypothetical protein EU535_07240 [Candidatus Lokiarchaeota archaeon]